MRDLMYLKSSVSLNFVGTSMLRIVRVLLEMTAKLLRATVEKGQREGVRKFDQNATSYRYKRKLMKLSSRKIKMLQ